MKHDATNRSYDLSPFNSHWIGLNKTTRDKKSLALLPKGSPSSGAATPIKRMAMGPTSRVSPSRTFVTVPDIDATCANAPEAKGITIPKTINSEIQLPKVPALGLKNSLVITLQKPGMKYENHVS